MHRDVGEVPFVPEQKETALKLSEKQQELSVFFDGRQESAYEHLYSGR